MLQQVTVLALRFTIFNSCSVILNRRALHVEVWVGTVACVTTDTIEMWPREKDCNKKKVNQAGN